MLHDVASFEQRGLPAVAILSDGFRAQAEYQARCLGLENAARVFVRHPISDQTIAELQKKADGVFDDAIYGLKNVPLPPAAVSEPATPVSEGSCST
mmetsp:Transcript_27359/g.76405  ORF Transcript_27359/g.76405 Transcript_27359/m.76405 type:complete len:96 (+) Transcript_27359:710-997(+)